MVLTTRRKASEEASDLEHRETSGNQFPNRLMFAVTLGVILIAFDPNGVAPISRKGKYKSTVRASSENARARETILAPIVPRGAG